MQSMPRQINMIYAVIYTLNVEYIKTLKEKLRVSYGYPDFPHG